jgi:hypothetical protein
LPADARARAGSPSRGIGVVDGSIGVAPRRIRRTRAGTFDDAQRIQEGIEGSFFVTRANPEGCVGIESTSSAISNPSLTIFLLALLYF